MDTANQPSDLAPQEPSKAIAEENESGEATALAEDAPPQTPNRLTVIGLGASAGGLLALRSFFATLPHDTGMTFVVVVHLSPEHESVLAELLQGYTVMPVRQVQTQVKMEPNHVYVIPPGKRLLVMDGHLDLADFDMPRGPRLQIDTFFRSLAEQHGDGAAILLSGTGSDGAVGIQSIKEKGGLILVQSPDEAEYDGMPKSAIATGLVDIVAPVQELATQLVAAKRTRATLQVPNDPNKLSEPAQQTLIQLLAQLRLRTGHDFSGYKQTTLLRRITRRMQLVQLDTLSAYLERLRRDGDELDALYRDLLIHVTEFFRDSASWSYLQREIIPRLFAGKRAEDSVRVWTVGCATGEEAYGIAILLLEHAATLDHPPHIQVFASDLGRLVLDFAREGTYPEAIAADVSEERLNRFFVKDNSHYRVRTEVRERVLFAPHNLLQDPPFSKLDLVLCRNLLIYLQRPVQTRVFDAFFYALRSQGFLFLGSAEATDGATELFDTVSKQHRVYQRGERHTNTLILPSLVPSPRVFATKAMNDTATIPAQNLTEPSRLLLEELGVPSLLVDVNHQVLHYSESVGRYLHHPAGRPTLNIMRLVRAELQSELRLALIRAFAQKQATRTRPVLVQFNGTPHPVTILVRPTPEEGQLLLIFLEDEDLQSEDVGLEQSEMARRDAHERNDELLAELQLTQQRLQTTREEYETTVEELRAANEELQSTNEEYRSTLEELETSKEELQSINEELQSVNQEMRSRVDEVTEANSDLQNLFAATEIATLFLDRDLMVKRYTPRAAQLFNLMPPDKGRPISHLRANLIYATLEADARQVLATLIPIVQEVKDDDGHWFLLSVRPYRTTEDKIDGVVITCVDISANKADETARRASEARYRTLFDSIDEGFCVIQVLFDEQGVPTDYAFLEANPAFETQTGLHDIVGKRMREVEPRHEAYWFEIYGRIAQTGEPERFTNRARYIGDRWYDVYAFRIEQPEERKVAVIFTDITRRIQAEESLRQFNEELEVAVRARTAQVAELVTQLTTSELQERHRISSILHDDLQQRLFSLLFQLTDVRHAIDEAEVDTAQQTIAQVAEEIERSIQIMRDLSVDLSPPVLHNEGLLEALRWLASRMQHQYDFSVELQADEKLPLPHEAMRILLFQSVRELLFNVVKHAGVNTAQVVINRADNHVRIQVVDKGDGMRLDSGSVQPNGQGLQRIAQRLQLLGGSLEIASTPGEGTTITITSPL